MAVINKDGKFCDCIGDTGLIKKLCVGQKVTTHDFPGEGKIVCIFTDEDSYGPGDDLLLNINGQVMFRSVEEVEPVKRTWISAQ